jgi:hypothetical protein
MTVQAEKIKAVETQQKIKEIQEKRKLVRIKREDLALKKAEQQDISD